MDEWMDKIICVGTLITINIYTSLVAENCLG
jgi:hypothetical protein